MERKKEYIWLNKEECESGKDVTMKLVEIESHERAVPFDENGNSNDFAKATKLQKQYLRIATEDCTKEELDMLVEVEMSKDDNYDTATPVFTEEQEKMINSNISLQNISKNDMQSILDEYGFKNTAELKDFLGGLSKFINSSNNNCKTKDTDDGRDRK